MEKLTFGMIGGGKGSFIADLHLKGALFDNMGTLAAGCFSRNYQKSLDFGSSMGIQEDRIYTTYQEMAEEEGRREDKIDFVIIAAPNNVHYECAKAFLENGIHVVCDKPLTHYSWEAEELKRIAEGKDLLFGVTYVYSMYPGPRFMREMISQGKIGRIRLVNAEYLTDNLAVSNDELGGNMAWRIDPKVAGRSTCVGDIGVHAQQLIASVSGLEMKEVWADMNIIGEDRVLDTNANVMVRYKGGAKGHIWCSNVVVGNNNNLNIAVYGEKGCLRWFQEDPDVVIFGELGGKETRYRMGTSFRSIGSSDIYRLPAGVGEGYYEAFANVYREFMTALLRKKHGEAYDISYPDICHGIESIKFVEACLKSNESSQWVKMD
ncbi:Gfo/Idh/MocA family oxidoreductase [Ruminococcus sp. OA3]|uniref:Gfo/Idh/MocA family protein n=1 Tax=Ruminococcus sp. OA3 TaxID=2914164 RepID=UPI001F05402C|nr:Gfo/Idh/MocA family oxidoreductase [Ruminococcus sp. OA3]MCH1983863.1 Gfo/Idh/MocA family oxidoreductase [Ruminococcus sp. OA3]